MTTNQNNIASVPPSSTSEMIKLYDRENLLKEYYDNHAVEFAMNNTYTLSCDTLDRAQGTKMVVLMHHVSAKGRHMNYQDYKYRDAVQGALSSAH